jgi:hypothetical protein
MQEGLYEHQLSVIGIELQTSLDVQLALLNCILHHQELGLLDYLIRLRDDVLHEFSHLWMMWVNGYNCKMVGVI